MLFLSTFYVLNLALSAQFSLLSYFCLSIYFLTRGVLLRQHFLSQIVPLVFSQKLVLSRHSRYAHSRLPCSQHSLLLTVNRTRIETLREATGDMGLRSLLVSFVEPCYEIFTPQFLWHLILFIRTLLRAVEN